MSLNLNVARKMLRQIVGAQSGQGFVSSGFIRYLGLSSTCPTGEPVASGNYNVTEPGSDTSYSRVALQSTGGSTFVNLYFISEAHPEYEYEETLDVNSSNYETYVANGLFAYNSETEEYVRLTNATPYSPTTPYYLMSNYEIVISNDNEIHFNEALQDWGTMKYFVIFENTSTKEPLYFGELIYDEYTNETSKVNADNFNTYVSTGLYISHEEGIYIKLDETATYDDTETYYIHHDGVEIKQGTVPLVRANQLRISVK